MKKNSAPKTPSETKSLKVSFPITAENAAMLEAAEALGIDRNALLNQCVRSLVASPSCQAVRQEIEASATQQSNRYLARFVLAARDSMMDTSMEVPLNLSQDVYFELDTMAGAVMEHGHLDKQSAMETIVHAALKSFLKG